MHQQTVFCLFCLFAIHDYCSALTDLEHLRGLAAARRDVVRLLQQRVNLVLLVQVADQLTLQVVLHIVDQEVHDGLRHTVLNVLPDNQEVRLDQTLCEDKKDGISLVV